MRTSALPDGLPVLSRGRHRTPKRGACFMELVSVLAGERWTDHPRCTHPLLGQLARHVNDLTTDEGRGLLMPLIPSVVGRQGDSLSPFAIAVAVATRQLLDMPQTTQRVLAAGLVRADQLCPDGPVREQARAGLDLVPAAACWVEDLVLPSRVETVVFGDRCAPAMLTAAVEGVVVYSGPGEASDRRLRDLLEAGIAACTVARTPLLPPVPPRRTPPRVKGWTHAR